MTSDGVPEFTHDAPVARRHLLVVLPHPDDESFSSAGVMAMHADAGIDVTYLCGTYGDMGRNMGRPFFANRETLRDVREKELADAAEILGFRVQFMGLRDKTVEFEDPDELAGRIADVARSLSADLLISFYPGHGVHPDHDAMGEASLRAVRSMDASERPRFWAVAVGDRETIVEQLGAPDVRVDIRAWADRKQRALEAHATQTKAMFERMRERAKEDEHLRARIEEGRRTERFYDLTP